MKLRNVLIVVSDIEESINFIEICLDFKLYLTMMET